MLINPYRSVIKQRHEQLDAINIMAYDYYWQGYDPLNDFAELISLGVPKDKIVWGIMPGRHDAMSEYTTVDDAVKTAKYVMENGLGGVMYWDVNRDTNHRSAPGKTSELFQTMQPDGTYLNAIHQGFNEAKMKMK